MQPGIDVRILSCYLAGSETSEFNVSELSRKIKAAYPHTHAAVTSMIKRGMLTSRMKGRSLVCRPDLHHPLTRNLLTRATIDAKAKQLKRPNQRNLDAEIGRLAAAEPHLLAVILKKNKLLFLITDKQAPRRLLKQTSLINIEFLTPEQLAAELASGDFLADTIILYGYERVLLTMASEVGR